MTTQNPARTSVHPSGGERVQPGGPLPGEVQRGGDTQQIVSLRYDAHLAYLDGRVKRARELNARADKLGRVK